MDPAIVLVGLGIVGVVFLERRLRWADGASDLADLMSGLFSASHDLGWPRGVQEEDLRPWVGTGSIAPEDEGPVEPVAIIEDSLDPVPVSPVRRAA